MKKLLFFVLFSSSMLNSYAQNEKGSISTMVFDYKEIKFSSEKPFSKTFTYLSQRDKNLQLSVYLDGNQHNPSKNGKLYKKSLGRIYEVTKQYANKYRIPIVFYLIQTKSDDNNVQYQNAFNWELKKSFNNLESNNKPVLFIQVFTEGKHQGSIKFSHSDLESNNWKLKLENPIFKFYKDKTLKSFLPDLSTITKNGVAVLNNESFSKFFRNNDFIGYMKAHKIKGVNTYLSLIPIESWCFDYASKYSAFFQEAVTSNDSSLKTIFININLSDKDKNHAFYKKTRTSFSNSKLNYDEKFTKSPPPILLVTDAYGSGIYSWLGYYSSFEKNKKGWLDHLSKIEKRMYSSHKKLGGKIANQEVFTKAHNKYLKGNKRKCLDRAIKELEKRIKATDKVRQMLKTKN